MMRIIIPVVLLTLFIGWILYRMLVKHDLKEKKNTDVLNFGVFFFSVWSLLYVLVSWI